MVRRCLIVDQLHDSIVPLLEQAGYQVDYQPQITREGVVKSIGSAVGLIVRNKIFIDREILDAGPNLKFIARAGAGLDLIEEEAVSHRNIQLINAPEGNRFALAEHALGLLLALLNKITQANHEVKNGLWNRTSNRGVNVRGKTIGIVGYGHMGSAFAELLSGFDCEVLAHDKYKTGPFKFAREVTLEELQLKTQILSLHVPLSDETHNMVDLEFFQRFNHDIYLLNTARGGIVNESDLVEMLNQGKILGAALDVLENENLQSLSAVQLKNFNQFKNSNHVIITPHVAGWSHESYQKINQVLVNKIKSLQF